MSDTPQQGPCETVSERLDRAPNVLEAYARDVERYGEPLDSGLPSLLRFVAEQLRTRAALAAEEEGALAEFAKWTIREGVWESTELDGGDIQDKAINLRLLVKVPYDPEKHGEPTYDYVELEAGDDWYVFNPEIFPPAPKASP